MQPTFNAALGLLQPVVAHLDRLVYQRGMYVVKQRTYTLGQRCFDDLQPFLPLPLLVLSRIAQYAQLLPGCALATILGVQLVWN